MAFLLGAMVALTSDESPLLGGGVVGGITFVAALILFSRDRGRYKAAVRTVRDNLLSRRDVTGAEFADRFPKNDSTLLLQTRQAIAEFFDVAESKVHPSDNLWDDFQFKTLEAELHWFVVYRVFAMREVEPQSFAFNTNDLRDIGDFASEIQRVLDGFDDVAENRGVDADSPR